LYSYGLNNSLYWIDPYGLAIEIRVAPGWGNSNLNHVYIWSTKYNKGRGRSGVSGKRDSDGTNLKEYEVVDVITDLNGYSEEEFKVPGTRT
ncbi:MAG: hypothetical protein KC618_07340, partial [Candidatus Omnitrophica bacterium]|nr:hypothetical protein [Candidatus Omnitrophota bacterium]